MRTILKAAMIFKHNHTDMINVFVFISQVALVIYQFMSDNCTVAVMAARVVQRFQKRGLMLLMARQFLAEFPSVLSGYFLRPDHAGD